MATVVLSSPVVATRALLKFPLGTEQFMVPLPKFTPVYLQNLVAKVRLFPGPRTMSVLPLTLFLVVKCCSVVPPHRLAQAVSVVPGDAPSLTQAIRVS